MKSNLYKFFHEKTNDRTENGLVTIPLDKTLWPKQWKEIEYKVYPRSKKTALVHHDESFCLNSLLHLRNSDTSKVVSGKPTYDHVSRMLKAGYGLLSEHLSRRTVPSGGGRFPLEIYVSVWGKVDGLPPGNYHYHVPGSNLETLLAPAIAIDEVKLGSPDTWVTDAHGVFIISAVFERSVNKYGDRGYRYILLEAGHVGQNICLAAAEVGLSVRPLGGINESFFENVLALDSNVEQVVYAIVF